MQGTGIPSLLYLIGKANHPPARWHLAGGLFIGAVTAEQTFESRQTMPMQTYEKERSTKEDVPLLFTNIDASSE
jgi:hypothetical protein